MIDATKFRVPVGSLVVDAAMVVSLIWWGATITERLESMGRRLEAVEAQKIQPEADRRISVMEARIMDMQDDVVKANEKLDRLLEKQ